MTSRTMASVWLGPIVAIVLGAATSPALAVAITGTPTVSDPVLCTEAPVTSDDLAASPPAPTATRSSIPVSPALPAGMGASAATTDAIAARVKEFFACTATGDMRRIAAFMSQRRLAGMSQESLAVLEPPPPDFRVEPRDGIYAGPWDVKMLLDGRVAAVIWMAAEDEHPSSGKTVLWIFVQEKAGWQIDEMITEVMPPGAKVPIPIADLVGTPQTGSANPLLDTTGS